MSKVITIVGTIPRIDSLFALENLLYAMGMRFEDVTMYFSPEDVPDSATEVIDLDAVRRYKDPEVNLPSATEMVVRERNLLNRVGVAKALEILKLNNGMGTNEGDKQFGGYLKSMKSAFAELIWDVPFFSRTEGRDEHLRKWVGRFLKVADVFFRAHAEIFAKGKKIDLEGVWRKFPEVANRLGERGRVPQQRDGYRFDINTEPEAMLTLPGYLAAKAVLDGEENLMFECEMWVDAFSTSRNLHNGARKSAEKVINVLKSEEQDGDAYGIRTKSGAIGIFVRTDKKLLARYLWPLLKDSSLVKIAKGPIEFMVIQERTWQDNDDGGHFCIQTATRSGVDIESLGRELIKLEPEAWMIEERFGEGNQKMILNSCAKIPWRPRSLLDSTALLEFVEAFVIRKTNYAPST